MYSRIIAKAKEESNLTKEEIIKLLKSSNDELYKAAEEVCEENKKNIVHIRGLIEYSNICKCNCHYCGLRRDNTKLERYRLKEEEIIEISKEAIKKGYKTVVLQSGEDSYYTEERVCKIIKEIKKVDIAVTLSIGERSYKEYKAFKEAGADRYLMRIETTDKELYKKLHPQMSIENRYECIKNLKKLGYETGTGIIVGLPKQNIEKLAEDILYFKEINADMVGIGPLIPHPNTPLRNANKDNFEMALKVMAITRLMMPDINIPATTAMEELREEGRIIALKSGANVIMQNITKREYRNKYEIYPKERSKKGVDDIENIENKLKKIGKKISISRGNREDIE